MVFETIVTVLITCLIGTQNHFFLFYSPSIKIIYWNKSYTVSKIKILCILEYRSCIIFVMLECNKKKIFATYNYLDSFFFCQLKPIFDIFFSHLFGLDWVWESQHSFELMVGHSPTGLDFTNQSIEEDLAFIQFIHIATDVSIFNRIVLFFFFFLFPFFIWVWISFGVFFYHKKHANTKD